MTVRSPGRVGVFVDGTNIARNGGYGMRFDVLREFITRGGGELMRANVYLSYDQERAAEDESFRRGQRNYHDRIIRSRRQLAALRRYIARNPARWALDVENPERPSSRDGPPEY